MSCTRQYRPWTKKEEDYLLDHMDARASALATRLQRSAQSIYNKRSKLQTRMLQLEKSKPQELTRIEQLEMQLFKANQRIAQLTQNKCPLCKGE